MSKSSPDLAADKLMLVLDKQSSLTARTLKLTTHRNN